MQFIYLALNWTFGILFLLTGALSLVDTPLGAMCLITIAILLLPPIRNFVYSKTNKKIPVKVKIILILLLVIAFGVFTSQYEDRNQQELAAQNTKIIAEEVAAIQKFNTNYFNNNSPKILKTIKEALANNNYKKVVTLSAKYLPSKNKELVDLHDEAKVRLIEIEKEEKVAQARVERTAKAKRILSRLKGIPASNYQANKKLYQLLVDDFPKNKSYQNKLKFYSKKADKAAMKERVKKFKAQAKRNARISQFGNPPVRSAWDGSYRAVEKYLKKVANDPDSIKIDNCTEVYQIKEGWLVGCDYRGRNGFGGIVRQSNWFTIIHGRVTQQHEASAYKP